MEEKNYASYETDIGGFEICSIHGKLFGVEFLGLTTSNRKSNPTPITDKTIKQLRDYIKGKRKTFDLPMVIEGTDFQKKVWKEISTIPYGKVKSYKEIAEKIGSPRAMRAVGSAHKANPLMVIIPCHRVVRSGETLRSIKYADKIQEAILKVEQAFT